MKTLNVLLLFVFFSLSLNAQKFTIPVFPDPQSEVDERMDMFESQVDWIVKNREKLNMPIVLCVGDLANFDNLPIGIRLASSLKSSIKSDYLML